MNPDIDFMTEAFREAEKAYKNDEVPVGSVIIHNNKIIAKGYNRTEGLKDPTAHAEIIALGAAANYLDSWRLEDASIYVTLEPCVMCIGAILNARIKKIYYGTPDPRMGSCGSRYDLVKDNPYIKNVVVVAGIMQPECEAILKSYFVNLRKKKKELQS